MNCAPNTLTRGEQTVLDVIRDHGPLTCREVAERVGSTKASIKALVWKLRKAGHDIRTRGWGPDTWGYVLVSGR
jgi:DNA-binding MarR family transcriptional regulator